MLIPFVLAIVRSIDVRPQFGGHTCDELFAMRRRLGSRPLKTDKSDEENEIED